MKSTKKQTKAPMDCYWRKAGSCNIPFDKFEKIAFIIASNDPSRIEVVNKIKNVLKEFNLEGIMAVDLEGNNNLSAFCDNICANIRWARINIVDVTAPLKECANCFSEHEEPSVNVYWEYGYAAGLKRPIILICEETQAELIPFNVLDKQILYYREETLEEDLGRVLKLKIEKSIESTPEEYTKKEDLLDIGKTTDLINNMGKGEMVNLIRKTKFEDLIDLTVNIMETIVQFETRKECKDHEGLYSFVFLLLKSTFTDEEYVKIFEIVFNKFLELNDYRTERIHGKIKEFINRAHIKDWIIKQNLLDKLIDIFVKSDSYKIANVNAGIIYSFNKELNQNQVIKIAKNSLENNQIMKSYKAHPFLSAIIDENRNEIPIDLWFKLYKKLFDILAIVTVKKLMDREIKITNFALKIILSFDNPWKKIDSISAETIWLEDFDKTITFEVLKKINNKELQEKILNLDFSNSTEEIIDNKELKKLTITEL